MLYDVERKCVFAYILCILSAIELNSNHRIYALIAISMGIIIKCYGNVVAADSLQPHIHTQIGVMHERYVFIYILTVTISTTNHFSFTLLQSTEIKKNINKQGLIVIVCIVCLSQNMMHHYLLTTSQILGMLNIQTYFAFVYHFFRYIYQEIATSICNPFTNIRTRMAQASNVMCSSTSSQSHVHTNSTHT